MYQKLFQSPRDELYCLKMILTIKAIRNHTINAHRSSAVVTDYRPTEQADHLSVTMLHDVKSEELLSY